MDVKKIGNLIDDAIDTFIDNGGQEINTTHEGGIEINIKRPVGSYIVTVNGTNYVSRGYGWQPTRI